jgi:DNA-binding response OmpR family regulator
MSAPARILVVDDNEDNRYTLTLRLRREGFQDVTVASNGREALELIGARPFDLILLDIMMPEMNGYEVLGRLKADAVLRHVPVIMISAISELDSVVRCIELGAEDYLPKPFNSVLLRARIGASLERKRLYDQQAAHLAEIERQRARGDQLLHAILPAPAVQELQTAERVAPRRFEDVAVVFGDLVGFTSYCERHPAEEVVANLDRLALDLERIAGRHALEQIKTTGDGFMATANLLEPHADQVMASARFAFEMVEAAERNPARWQIRLGIHVGSVVAGVVGRSKFTFDLWGDTVNTAARLSGLGSQGAVYLSGDAWRRLEGRCPGHCLGRMSLKGKGEIEVYLCARPEAAPAPPPAAGP